MLPIVWGANLAGEDFARVAVHQRWDKLMAAITVAVAALLIYWMATLFFRPFWASAWTAMLVLGGPIASTMGTTLWSINWVVVLELAALLMLLRDKLGLTRLNGWLLGGLLGLAYLCRPTAQVFNITVLAYLLFARRRCLLGALSSWAVFVVLLAGLSWGEYKQLLPDYYLPARISNLPLRSWLTALYGGLFSPARGLLIYCPFVVVAAACAFSVRKTLAQQGLFIMALCGVGVHWLLVSRFDKWWGGWSYGPRLLADVYPALVLAVLLIARFFYQNALPRFQKGVAVAWMLSGLAAILINTAQGLYNPNVMLWNDFPNIDDHPDYLFDWRFPQFLATTDLLNNKAWDFQLRSKSPVHLSQVLRPNNDNLLWQGWSTLETTTEGQPFRWTDGYGATIVFRLADDTPTHTPTRLDISASLFQSQHITVSVNGRDMGYLTGKDYTRAMLTLPPGTLYPGRVNVIKFVIPQAHTPAEASANSADQRLLGLGLGYITFYE